ncbi:ABC transporter ATP-binding protein [Streptomyces sp. DSM 44915]|uniref:ABC transporter ATP-binding protein n=1 Tax=Streptomyces chisholmiae TaxID=3075540 RepID=A0ABU2JME9_9ACTN|nr:ABC transporter ATP-binding protein [Streptomyces sp. DSM 44915]MDT0266092.1 ABC transporter ATP-binding protein [Streptomyces sp. DSM 44915]
MTHAVEIEELTRVYPRKGQPDLTALSALSLSVPQGEVHSLLGPNGAGKTTLCRILSTVLLPSSGSARVLGHDVVRDTAAVKRSIGVVFGGDRGLYNRLTARQNLEFWASLYGLRRAARRQRADELLARVGLSGRADQPVQSYSRGMKQRLHLARGLVADPGVLILDEPTVGMDPLAARDFRALVREQRARGRTILMTTHDMAEAADLSDRVSFVDNGRLTLTESPETVGRLVSERERVEVQEALPAELGARLAEVPGVVSVTGPGERPARVETAGTEATRQVMGLLLAAGITDLAKSRPSLEETYLHLLGSRGMDVGR